MNDRTLIYILLVISIAAFGFSFIRDLFSRKPTAAAKNELPPGNASVTLPLQLQAYERLVLLTERISPENLVSRTGQPGLSLRETQQWLVQQIRAEFDHNVAQQIYVSVPAWDAVRNAKEQLISLINRLADQLPENATGLELNKRLLALTLQSEDPFPTKVALEVLNAEAKKLMSQG